MWDHTYLHSPSLWGIIPPSTGAYTMGDDAYIDWPESDLEHETQFYPAFKIFRYPIKSSVTKDNLFSKSYKAFLRLIGALIVIFVRSLLTRKRIFHMGCSQLAVHASIM